MTKIKYTASDRQLIVENGGVLPRLPAPQRPAPAIVAGALEHIHQQRAAHIQSRLPSFLIGGDHNYEFRAEESGVIGAWTKTKNPETGEPEDVSVIETAYKAYRSGDQKEKFASFRLAAEVSMIRGTQSRAPEAETELMLELCLFLDELADGNFSAAILPEKRAVGKSSATAQAEAALVCLVEYRKKRDGCSRLKAASRVLRDLDAFLKPQQICVADWLRGGVKSMADHDEPIHGHAAGVVRWIEDKKVPTQEMDAFKVEATTLEEAIAEAEQASTAGLLYEKLVAHTANRIARNIKRKD